MWEFEHRVWIAGLTVNPSCDNYPQFLFGTAPFGSAEWRSVQRTIRQCCRSALLYICLTVGVTLVYCYWMMPKRIELFVCGLPQSVPYGPTLRDRMACTSRSAIRSRSVSPYGTLCGNPHTNNSIRLAIVQLQYTNVTPTVRCSTHTHTHTHITHTLSSPDCCHGRLNLYDFSSVC